MASPSLSSSSIVLLAVVYLFAASLETSSAQLTTNFYSSSCPQLFSTVKSVVQSAINKEARMGASLLRLFFHDCFVNVNFIITFLLFDKFKNIKRYKDLYLKMSFS